MGIDTENLKELDFLQVKTQTYSGLVKQASEKDKPNKQV